MKKRVRLQGSILTRITSREFEGCFWAEGLLDVRRKLFEVATKSGCDNGNYQMMNLRCKAQDETHILPLRLCLPLGDTVGLADLFTGGVRGPNPGLNTPGRSAPLCVLRRAQCPPHRLRTSLLSTRR
jgi:hypothetical protein